MRLNPGSDGPARVIVAGGGAAGLEALIALRTLAKERVELELISPERTFSWRSLAVAAAFGSGQVPGIDVEAITRSVDAEYSADSVVHIDAATRTVTTATGETRDYDALIMCSGASTEVAIPGAIMFGGPNGPSRFRQVLEHAEAGRISRLVFAVPADAGWPLALYELALLSAERLRDAPEPVQITLITPEHAPLASFGGRASAAMLGELENRGIHFIAGLLAEEIVWGELRASPGGVRITADAVITLPRLRGSAVPGLTADEHGFIPIDAHGLVRGTTNVYAAGDAVAFPIKHGGLATQQADAAAEAIAARVGAALSPAPFAPVLRGVLLTGDGPRRLEAAAGASAGSGAISTRPLWWPPAKIAGRYLGPYMSGHVAPPPASPSSVTVDVELNAETGSVQAATATC